jgi:hypothetical protein
MSSFRTAALAPLLVLGCAMQAAHAKDPPLLTLTAEHFRDTATIKDDPRDAAVTISTVNGYVEHTGPLRMVWHDAYLTAVINKKTGQKSFQVQEEITYSGRWRFYEAASIPTSSGPRRVPTTQISKEVVDCAVGDCTYTERIAFPVDEDLLRQLAAGYAPGKAAIWPYKIAARSGPDFTSGLSNAEIAGLLAKLDDYSRAPAAVQAIAPIAPAAVIAPEAVIAPAAEAIAPGRPDLGIGGLPVAATAEHPNRAGILITAVNGGSVAARAGIIVGDILYEFNGRPVRAVAQLQAAIAACDANSAVPVKLYRGLDPMAVTAQF